ncbi:hypothetical protein DRQ36_08120 [bacterium]|nr:MAG: hypothetical protein DRQ36_08120 [bacterium]
MIVVVIIGILAALAINRYSRAAKKAKIAEARIVLKNIWTCCQTYYNEHGKYPPRRNDIGRDGYPEIGFSPLSGVSRFKYEFKEEGRESVFIIKAKCKKKGAPGYDPTLEHIELRCNEAGDIWVHKGG